ncbi:type II toxin-antitoxin system VapC family toxin [Rubrimonas cliftonensis]|uniref:Ribonuclease VapC n=1 Tax=Rubrimonas cliftonensis TaxID=89524 RepID=A0A1H4GHR8_9RHOB|nr:type II toxin-antitoxin system VapC family toxin [Rubrimonas cliftonensis]SEB08408.1 Predicted nucleic-acid-binding protein, contains PIN domain [Rubrimonas cliftonensis]
MVVIDTNVLVRFLTRDDEEQARRARALVEAESVYLPLTVALETEWVLRAAYRRATAEIVAGLRGFAGLASVTVEAPERLARALALAEDGMDFPDALHLCAANPGWSFATFDLRLIKAAKGRGLAPTRAP